MTVAELVQELQKYPPHYTAMLITTPWRGDVMLDAVVLDADASDDGDCSTWSFIGEVEIETGVGSLGPIVKIIAEDA
jgi:hypothetical protein